MVLSHSILCQNITPDKKFCNRLASGFAFSSANSSLKDFFKEHNFDVTHDGLFGERKHPRSTALPVVLDMFFEYKIGHRFSLATMVSFGPFIGVKGFGRFGPAMSGRFITYKHRSGAISILPTFYNHNGQLGFYGGPTLDRQSYFYVSGIDENDSNKKRTSLGLIMGVWGQFNHWLGGFISLRYLSGVTYDTVDLGGGFSLPEKHLNASHVRMGLTSYFGW